MTSPIRALSPASAMTQISPVSHHWQVVRRGAPRQLPDRALDAIVIFSPHDCHQELWYGQRPNTQKLHPRPRPRLHARRARVNVYPSGAVATRGIVVGSGVDGSRLCQPSGRQTVAASMSWLLLSKLKGETPGTSGAGTRYSSHLFAQVVAVLAV